MTIFRRRIDQSIYDLTATIMLRSKLDYSSEKLISTFDGMSDILRIPEIENNGMLFIYMYQRRMFFSEKIKNKFGIDHPFKHNAMIESGLTMPEGIREWSVCFEI